MQFLSYDFIDRYNVTIYTFTKHKTEIKVKKLNCRINKRSEQRSCPPHSQPASDAGTPGGAEAARSITTSPGKRKSRGCHMVLLYTSRFLHLHSILHLGQLFLVVPLETPVGCQMSYKCKVEKEEGSKGNPEQVGGGLLSSAVARGSSLPFSSKSPRVFSARLICLRRKLRFLRVWCSSNLVSPRCFRI